MSTIDNRVVHMEFDNKQFEQGVSTTMTTLAKLKEALNFKKDNLEQGLDKTRGALSKLKEALTFKKGNFDELQQSVNAVSFDPLSNQVTVVQQRFSLLGEFVHAVFDRISNKVIDTATTIGRALTVEPLMQGFNEYGLNLDSTRTIMSGSGESLEKVTAALNELNEYADKTIYSFSDMTQSIGKFTNAGVELDPAVAAIKGISNAAADAGADTQKASIAMYNLSQSMAQGYLSLQDWRSVNNTAGMGTKDFRQNLIDTAVAMGTLRKEGDKYVSTTTNNQGKVSDAFDAFKGFDMSLQHQWATTEVMTEAYRHYAKSIDEMTESEREAYEESLREIGFDEEQIARIEEIGKRANKAATEVRTVRAMWDALTEGVGSGWAQSFQYIFGDLDEATALWTGIKDEIEGIIGPIADARNEMLKYWHDAEKGGRATLIESLGKAWQGVKTVMGALSGAFQKVFPPVTGETLVKITNTISDMATKFNEAATNSRNLNRVTDIAKGVFNAFKMAGDAVGLFWSATQPVRDVLGDFAVGIADSAAAVGRLLTGMANSKNPIKYLVDGMNGIGWGGKRINDIITTVTTTVEKFAKGLLDLIGIHIEGNPLTDFVEKLRGFAGEHLSFPSFDTLKGALESIKGVFSAFGEMASGGINGVLTGIGTALDFVFGMFNGAADKVDAAGKSIGNMSKSVGTLDNAKGILDGFIYFVSSMADIVIRVFSTVADYLPKAFDYLASADFQKLVGVFTGIMTGSLINSVRKFVDTLSATNAERKKGGFFDLINTLKESSNEAVKAFTEVLVHLSEALAAFTNSVNASAILKAAAGVGILVASIAVLASLDATKMANGVAAITAITFSLFAGFSRLDAGSGMVVATGVRAVSTALIKIAVAVGILALAATGLSKLNMDQLAIGILGITGAMAVMIAGVSGLAKYGGSIQTTAGSMIGIAIAIGILSLAVKSMTGLGEKLAGGLTGVGILLAELVAFSKFFDSAGITPASATGILLLSVALKVLESSVKSFADMKWDELERGLTSVGVLLLAVAAFSAWANTDTLTVSSAVSVLLLSAALKVLETSVKSFASMKWDELEQGLAGVGLLLIELAAFSMMMSGYSLNAGAVVSIIALTGVVTVLSEVVKSLSGLGITGLETGIAGLAMSLGILVVALGGLSAGSASMIAGAAALTVMAIALRIFVPVLQTLASIGDMGVLVSLVGLAGALTILAVAGATFGGLAPVLLTGAAALAALGAACAVAGIGILAVGTGLAAMGAGIVAFGAAIAMNAAGIATALMTLGGAVGGALAKAITEFVTGIFTGQVEVVKALGTAIHAIGDFIVTEIPYIMGIWAVFFTNLFNMIAGQAPALANSVGQLISGFLVALVAWIPPIVNTLLEGLIVITDALANGIRDNGPRILAAVGNIISAILELFLTALQNLVSLIPGIGPKIAGALEGAKDGLRSTLAPESLEEITEGAMEGAASGVEKGGEKVQEAANGVGNEARDSIAGPLSGLSGDADGSMLAMIATLTGYNGDMSSAGNLLNGSFVDSISNPEALAGTGTGMLGVLSGELSSEEALAMLSSSGDVDFDAWLTSFTDPAKAQEAGATAVNNVAAGADNQNGVLASSGSSGSAAYDSGFGSGGTPNEAAAAKSASLQQALMTNLGIMQAAGEAASGAYDDTVASSDGSAGSVMAQTAANAAASETGAYETAATNVTGAFSSKVEAADTGASGRKIAKAGASAASSERSSWSSAGTNLSDGLANGIIQPAVMSRAMSAARTLVSNTLAAAKAAMNSNSPSKETMKYGRWFTEGFAIGINQLSDYAAHSGAKLAQKTVDALAVSAESINNYTKLDYDIDPTIRPVLDLTEIQNGVSKAGTLIGGLDSKVSLGLGEMSYASGIINGIGTTTTVESVVSALEEQNARNIASSTRMMLDEFAGSQIDYELLGAAVASALVGMSVTLDGRALVGELANSASRASRMYAG